LSKLKITYRTKEESNLAQERAFVKLSGVERFYKFLEMMMFVNQFPTKNKDRERKDKENFIILIDRV